MRAVGRFCLHALAVKSSIPAELEIVTSAFVLLYKIKCIAIFTDSVS